MNKLFIITIFAAVIGLSLFTNCRKRTVYTAGPDSMATPDYTSNMGGMRTWTGTRYEWLIPGPGVLYDTTIDLTTIVISNSAILIMNDTLRYSSSDTIAQKTLFTANVNRDGEYRTISLYYYYLSDSMVFSRTKNIGHGYQETFALHTP